MNIWIGAEESRIHSSRKPCAIRKKDHEDQMDAHDCLETLGGVGETSREGEARLL